jgi:cytochrome c-type biogenesis protein CcmH/NrfG
MSTGAIIAIVVAVILVLAVLFVMLPRMRARKAQHQLVGERHDAAEAHRGEAERRAARAQLAEREAERERAEAQLHETRADLHDQGLADDELGRDSRAARPAAPRRDRAPDADAPAGDRRRV